MITGRFKNPFGERRKFSSLERSQWVAEQAGWRGAGEVSLFVSPHDFITAPAPESITILAENFLSKFERRRPGSGGQQYVIGLVTFQRFWRFKNGERPDTPPCFEFSQKWVTSLRPRNSLGPKPNDG
jgi:hypothetical protein